MPCSKLRTTAGCGYGSTTRDSLDPVRNSVRERETWMIEHCLLSLSHFLTFSLSLSLSLTHTHTLDGRVRVWIDNQLIIDQWDSREALSPAGTFSFPTREVQPPTPDILSPAPFNSCFRNPKPSNALPRGHLLFPNSRGLQPYTLNPHMHPLCLRV